MSNFNANVILRPFAERPWHHFRIKPNDPLFDSTDGMNDAAQSGTAVLLPGGIIYSDQINFDHGGRLVGVGAWYKTQSDLVTGRDPGPPSGGETIIQFNGATGTNKALINFSLGTDIKTDVIQIVNNIVNLHSCGLFNVTLDANGNSYNATGGRNADGAASCDIAWFMNRCGNTALLGHNISIMGAQKAGMVALGVFSAAIDFFQIIDCPHSSCWIGWNDPNYFDWATRETTVNSLRLTNWLIKDNGRMAYEGNKENWIGGGGHNTAGVDNNWGVNTAGIQYGSAMMMAGRNCYYGHGTYELNGGPLVFGATTPGPHGPSTLENVYFEANEALSDRATYATTGDLAVGLVFLNDDANRGFNINKCFMGGGSSNGAPVQTIRIQNIGRSGQRVTSTSVVDTSAGPSDQEDWVRFSNMQFPSTFDVGNGANKVNIASGTQRYRWEAKGNPPLGTTLASAYVDSSAPPTKTLHANTLDLVGETSAGTFSQSSSSAYIKHGALVTYFIDEDFTSFTGTGNLKITNLPFASTETTQAPLLRNVRASPSGAAFDIYGQVNNGATEILLFKKNTNGDATDNLGVRLTEADLASSAIRLIAQFQYPA